MIALTANPEFIRHVRTASRPARLLTLIFVTLVVCALAGLSGTAKLGDNNFFRDYFFRLLVMQFVGAIAGCAYYCGNAIARERQLGTFDFLRTTSLTADELILGKLLGEPMLAWVVVGVTLPVSLVAGILGGINAEQLLLTYLLLASSTLLAGVAALAASLRTDRSGGGLAIILLLGIGSSLSFALVESPIGGFAALSPIPALSEIYKWEPTPQAMVFAQPVSYFSLTMFLHATLGAWIYLMLARNLKRNPGEERLLSRWQSLAFVTYWGLLLQAFWKPGKLDNSPPVLIALSTILTYVAGVLFLVPREDLYLWNRRRHAGRASYLDESGPPWPWIVAAATIAFVLIAALGPLKTTSAAALSFAICACYTVRDLLFVQFCLITRMRHAAAQALLYLSLYYIGMAMLEGASPAGPLTKIFESLTFFPAIAAFKELSAGMYFGTLAQIFVSAVIMLAIQRRLDHMR